MNSMRTKTWIARLFVAAVFAINVQCAGQFIFNPAAYLDAYQLQGIGAPAAIQGIGIAFLMWNATYPLVIACPSRFRTLFGVVIAQQVIGLVGELALKSSLDASASVLAGSIERFVAFDAAGLVVLVIAFLVSKTTHEELRNR